MLPEIIGRETEFQVLSITDGVAPERDKFYITPENFDVVVEGNTLKLISPSRDAAIPKPSVNRLFKSLAAEKGENAIAIILSGTGSDGSEGIRDIRARGGITITQDELTSKYSGMPSAAIDTGQIDLIMSPEEIGAKFGDILATPRDFGSLTASPVHHDGMTELIHLIHNQRRVNFKYYKTATLQRRIERRMAAIASVTFRITLLLLEAQRLKSMHCFMIF